MQKEFDKLKLDKSDKQVMNTDPVRATNYPFPLEPTFSPSGQIKSNITIYYFKLLYKVLLIIIQLFFRKTQTKKNSIITCNSYFICL